MGFVLTTEEANALIAKNPKNRDVLFPVLNGEDLNSSPAQSPSRWIINFFDWEKEVAEQYPDCFSIVQAKVLPERQKHGEKKAREFWWRYARLRPELNEAITNLNRVIAVALTSRTMAFAFQPKRLVYSQAVIVIAVEDFGAFATLQSTIHTEWAREFGSSMKGDSRYTPTDCFETFPFFQTNDKLKTLGESYYQIRRDSMLSRSEGLTAYYDRFHDRGEQSADIARLRALHEEMDQAVAAAYGWSDLDLGHGFHATKQGERYTLSEPARRTVLDRLLAINHQRYAEELKAGLHEKKKPKAKGRKPKVASATASMQGELIPSSQEAARFVLPLIPFLLSEAARTSVTLRMSELKRAFDFITDPALMESAAKPGEKVAVKKWSASWRSPAEPEWFFRTLRQLAGATVRATTDEDDPPMKLVVAPTRPDASQLLEGIRLALLVVRTATDLPPEEKAAVVQERHSIFTTV